MVISDDKPSTCYIRLRKQSKVPPGQPVRLGDVAEVIVDSAWEAKLKHLVLLNPKPKDGNILLVDMMAIVRAIKAVAPALGIECFGQPHTLVEIVKQAKRPNPFFIAIVWLLLFFGSGLAIMNFHADVSMLQVHHRIIELLTGRKEASSFWFQACYSIGIGLGMVIFFNHIFRKKFNEEPTPLEVEMYLYQENLNQYIVTEEYQRLREADEKRE
ncbi:stage V sporulation protein AA [Paenibacillus apiarius]|uniref:Stage V sporulation protein AA n=1 Tax=Paenibacillus apiarius TaxID=46240 RepID=A0ABT4DSJ3_9BACL|nr:stage V sporulation protein AA [Paenibacillus apiarius]MCY9517192.1 stage V sporulation protein AA [Paenibacillus apiarius]MCY9519213.1 stage V sporulation protein AA [Paenibacillus apiarius]MCY9555141.1 stage V sporulation protein AA [Paenibacillus apiarius]MCY9559991.1 stage V sporulation protein AA [Paenibacillus apiarius]MCY9683366.1 stage V sporulation protein AA [Paenibacillus apiarius]